MRKVRTKTVNIKALILAIDKEINKPTVAFEFSGGRKFNHKKSPYSS